MKHKAPYRSLSYVLISIPILMIIIGTLLLVHTISRYNRLTLERQDIQMLEMVHAADDNLAAHMNNLQQNLDYIIGRRGFAQAENTWIETGAADDLVTRMQENIVAQDSLVYNLLAIVDGKAVLAAYGPMADYYFPAGLEGDVQPCFTSDGSMYLAILKDTQHARYAALLSLEEWYEKAVINSSTEYTLYLLGNQEKILLHSWQGEHRITAVEELDTSNCDLQALQNMVTCRASGQALTASYNMQFPGQSHIHEMRMAALPLAECKNGYFVMGLTCDFDEIARPMHQAAIELVFFGGLVILGILLVILMAIHLAHQNRHRDRELQKLARRNEETQRLLEKQKELAHHQRLETIGTLTASIAHEFNNLLTPIMGYSILTLEALPEGSDDLADNVMEIYEASRKAKEIISRLNALSRRNAEESFRTLSLPELATRALTVARPAQPAHVTTSLNCGSDGCWVSGIETQLSQLLLNLILNAYQAMEKAGGRLTLTIATEESTVVLTAADTGPGISPEVLPHIFDPFFTTKESGHGTGLGLAIVQQVAQSHHGSISVQSTPGQGAAFTLRLPLATLPESSDP